MTSSLVPSSEFESATTSMPSSETSFAVPTATALDVASTTAKAVQLQTLDSDPSMTTEGGSQSVAGAIMGPEAKPVTISQPAVNQADELVKTMALSAMTGT
jgi:hypothetical protein